MEAFTVLVVISLLLFDTCCICYLKKNVVGAMEKLINKLMKEMDD